MRLVPTIRTTGVRAAGTVAGAAAGVEGGATSSRRSARSRMPSRRPSRPPSRTSLSFALFSRTCGRHASCEGLTQTYLSGGRELTVLKDITFALEQGGFLSIVGPSGSGKTTLLGLLAGLDRARAGRVVLDDADLGGLTEDERARLRAEKVGFVFQSFQLIPTLTARENVQVPLELTGKDGGARADELLARVGLGKRGHHYPAQLSGGEQQRVALARAFANQPRILFADEPTGNLDSATGETIVELMLELNRDFGTTIVLVTHDLTLAARARRTIRLADGRIVSDTAA